MRHVRLLAFAACLAHASCKTEGCSTLPDVPNAKVTTLASGIDPTYLVSDATSLYWLDRPREAIFRFDVVGGGAPQHVAPAKDALGLALDEQFLYFALPGALVRVPKAGGPSATFASVDGRPEALAVDDAHIYWLDINKASAFRLPKSGEGTPLLLGKDVSLCLPSLAVDDAFLYWQGQVPRAVMRMPKGGGPIVPIAPVETYWASNLSVDPTSAYWWAEQRVWQVDKRGGKPRALVRAEAKHPPVWLVPGASAFYLMLPSYADSGGGEPGPVIPHTGKLVAISR